MNNLEVETRGMEFVVNVDVCMLQVITNALICFGQDIYQML